MLKEGSGRTPKRGEVVVAHYVVALEDGSVFDSSRERNKELTFMIGIGSVGPHVWQRSLWQRVVAALVVAALAAVHSSDRCHLPPQALVYTRCALILGLCR